MKDFSKYRKSSFYEMVEKLKVEIRQSCIWKLRDKSGFCTEWLRTLYNNYTQRFLSDNARIWITASIMIPLSLAAFAALPTIEKPHFAHLVVLAIASIAVIISWLIIAENHRSFQHRAEWGQIFTIHKSLGRIGIKPSASQMITPELSGVKSSQFTSP